MPGGGPAIPRPFKAFCMPGRTSRFWVFLGPLGVPRMLEWELIRSLPRTRCNRESPPLLTAPPRPPLPAGRPPCRPLGPRGLCSVSINGLELRIKEGLTHFRGHCRPCPCHMLQVLKNSHFRRIPKAPYLARQRAQLDLTTAMLRLG